MHEYFLFKRCLHRTVPNPQGHRVGKPSQSMPILPSHYCHPNPHSQDFYPRASTALSPKAMDVLVGFRICAMGTCSVFFPGAPSAQHLSPSVVDCGRDSLTSEALWTHTLKHDTTHPLFQAGRCVAQWPSWTLPCLVFVNLTQTRATRKKETSTEALSPFNSPLVVCATCFLADVGGIIFPELCKRVG